jgi:hypothetical protein
MLAGYHDEDDVIGEAIKKALCVTRSRIICIIRQILLELDGQGTHGTDEKYEQSFDLSWKSQT